MVQKV
ncbi:hypothetical protein AZE42_13893 [Rhizopogon vesiculosus]